MTDSTIDSTVSVITPLPNNGIDISRFVLTTKPAPSEDVIVDPPTIPIIVEPVALNGLSNEENLVSQPVELDKVAQEQSAAPYRVYVENVENTFNQNYTEDLVSALDTSVVEEIPTKFIAGVYLNEEVETQVVEEKNSVIDKADVVVTTTSITPGEVITNTEKEVIVLDETKPPVYPVTSKPQESVNGDLLANKKKKTKHPNQKGNTQMVERDVTDLLSRFDNGKKNKPKQQAVLLVPANRAANSYLRQAFSNLNGLDGEDGIDFINISYAANTKLGAFLDINAHTPFEHPEIGKFESVGGVWYYIKSEVADENFRFVWGDRVRNMGKRIIPREVHGFRTIIADATWVKIVSNQEVMKDMAASTAPFKNFYYYGPLNIKKSIQETTWYVVALEEIRRTLKLRESTGNNNLQPDFVSLENNHIQR